MSEVPLCAAGGGGTRRFRLGPSQPGSGALWMKNAPVRTMNTPKMDVSRTYDVKRCVLGPTTQEKAGHGDAGSEGSFLS